MAAAFDPAGALKRRPNGCDWIGGDFAEPGEVMFHTGCPAGGRRAAAAAKAKDEPPKPLDRPDARAPVNYGASTRRSIGKGLESFQIAGSFAYGVDGGGRLWRVGLTGKSAATMVAPAAVRFRAAASGPLFVLEKDGTLWRAGADGSNREFVDHLVEDFQPAPDALYILGTDKRLWRLHAGGKGRDPVDENVVAFQALDAKTVFVLASDGSLWRETGDMHDRAKVGQPVAAFEYIAEGDTTYVLTPSHFLWRQKGMTGPPEQVDHDVAAFHAVDARLVYALALDGRLWQEPGTRARATLVDGDLAVKLGPAAFQFASPGDVEGQTIYALDRKHELWAETMPSTKGPGG
jgi:hypothetical protein